MTRCAGWACLAAAPDCCTFGQGRSSASFAAGDRIVTVRKRRARGIKQRSRRYAGCAADGVHVGQTDLPIALATHRWYGDIVACRRTLSQITTQWLATRVMSPSAGLLDAPRKRLPAWPDLSGMCGPGKPMSRFGGITSSARPSRGAASGARRHLRVLGQRSRDRVRLCGALTGPPSRYTDAGFAPVPAADGCTETFLEAKDSNLRRPSDRTVGRRREHGSRRQTHAHGDGLTLRDRRDHRDRHI